jgi:hypothetical protein
MTKTLEVPVLAQPEKVIKVGINNLEPGSVTDERSQFKGLPANLDDFVVIASPINRGRTTELTRTGTEGRALAAHVEPFSDFRGVNYSDILVKGVGGRDRETIQLKIDDKIIITPRASARPGGTKTVPLRFSPSEVRGVQGTYGISAVGIGNLDSERSEILAAKGLRTRKLILSGQYPDRKIFATDKGVVTRTTLSQQMGVQANPSIELWAMRCRYRVQDITEQRFDNKAWISSSSQLFEDNNWDLRDNYESRVINEGRIKQEEVPQIEQTFSRISAELYKRMLVDDDPRFRSIAAKYADTDLSDNESRSNFLKDYIATFGRLLGEQVGVMYGQGLLQKIRCLIAKMLL